MPNWLGRRDAQRMARGERTDRQRITDLEAALDVALAGVDRLQRTAVAQHERIVQLEHNLATHKGDWNAHGQGPIA